MPNNHKTFEGFQHLTGFDDLTPEEKSLIEKEFFDLLDCYINSNHRKKIDIIKSAFLFALLAHKGVRRRSGEPYILHPIAVAQITAKEIGLGSTSICAALLHDVIEDTEYTKEDLERNFNPKIAEIVEGLTKISGGVFGDKASAQAENFRKLLLTMSDDIRVVLIKIADRLHNMRTLGSMPTAKQFKIAGETEYIYAPLAHRLGLFRIKSELENLSFLYDRPELYHEIEQKLDKKRVDINLFYNEFTNPIQKKLEEAEYNFEIQKRIKTVYSIWKKMSNKNISFEEIRDILAVRIIFEPKPDLDEKVQCWMIYSAVTSIYRPHPERIKDWVSIPKANGYEALHVTVMKPGGEWVEIQIRSKRMHDVAERGLAAHWKYKNNSQADATLDDWLETIKDLLKNPESSAVDSMENIKLNLYSSEIFVFTPKGEMKVIKKDATVLDFAFNLHSDIGFRSIAAKINYKLVPLNHILQSGDRVEILTSNKQEPKEEWLDFVTTGSAKSKLKQYFNKRDKEIIEVAKKQVEEVFEKPISEIHSSVVNKLLNHFNIRKWDDLLLQIGLQVIDVKELKPALEKKTKEEKNVFSRLLKNPFGNLSKKESKEKREENSQSIEEINFKKTYLLNQINLGKTYELSDCCHPIPGDDVMGYANEKNIIQVHKRDCNIAKVIKSNFGNRIVNVEWTVLKKSSFTEKIEIKGIDEKGILIEILKVISLDNNIDISKIKIEKKNELFIGTFSILVQSTQEINNIINHIGNIPQVNSVRRLQ
ncbi:MAG: GTP pyrophosphokinase [Paludibacter sp.]|nr:MAG: GTP pyrophosphokinase [Paludibacter sp.]